VRAEIIFEPEKKRSSLGSSSDKREGTRREKVGGNAFPNLILLQNTPFQKKKGEKAPSSREEKPESELREDVFFRQKDLSCEGL